MNYQSSFLPLTLTLSKHASEGYTCTLSVHPSIYLYVCMHVHPSCMRACVCVCRACNMHACVQGGVTEVRERVTHTYIRTYVHTLTKKTEETKWPQRCLQLQGSCHGSTVWYKQKHTPSHFEIIWTITTTCTQSRTSYILLLLLLLSLAAILTISLRQSAWVENE